MSKFTAQQKRLAPSGYPDID